MYTMIDQRHRLFNNTSVLVE
ncbi:protein of unknown function [Cupriavidus taiwanensis]|nr:protein of unknown function [Cupriavidus taiwanensis]